MSNLDLKTVIEEAKLESLSDMLAGIVSEIDDEEYSDKVWEVASSRENIKYSVERRIGAWTCTCTGFKFRGKCHHITDIQDEIEGIVRIKLPAKLKKIIAQTPNSELGFHTVDIETTDSNHPNIKIFDSKEMHLKKGIVINPKEITKIYIKDSNDKKIIYNSEDKKSRTHRVSKQRKSKRDSSEHRESNSSGMELSDSKAP